MESEIQLTRKITDDFHKFAMSLPEYPMDYGAMRELRIELMEMCGAAPALMECLTRKESCVLKQQLDGLDVSACELVSKNWKIQEIIKEYALCIPPALNDRILWLSERKKELAMKDMEKRYENWRQILYIRQLIDIQETVMECLNLNDTNTNKFS